MASRQRTKLSLVGLDSGTFGAFWAPTLVWRWIVASSALVGLVAIWASGASARELVRREAHWGIEIRHGDLVFQDLDCGMRCELIRRVTESRYSHVGIVIVQDGERLVWEAFHPVGPTPIGEWVGRGRGDAIAVYRPRRVPAGLLTRLETMRGRPYDGDYQWDEERIYCSELVAKAWDFTLVEPHAVDLGAFESQVAEMTEGRLTSETLLVSPRDLVDSGHFERVVDELRSHGSPRSRSAR